MDISYAAAGDVAYNMATLTRSFSEPYKSIVYYLVISLIKLDLVDIPGE